MSAAEPAMRMVLVGVAVVDLDVALPVGAALILVRHRRYGLGRVVSS